MKIVTGNRGTDYIFETHTAEDQLSELAAYFDHMAAQAEGRNQTAREAVRSGRRPKGDWMEKVISATAEGRAYDDAGNMVRVLIQLREALAKELEIRNAAEALGWEFDDDVP